MTETIFDVATKPLPSLFLWSCAGAVAFGCLILLVAKLPRRRKSFIHRFFGYFMIVSGVTTAVVLSFQWHRQRKENIRSLQTGHYQVVQGVVEDFHPQASDGSSDESFSISGHQFSYSDYVESGINTCYNRTSLRNGPIHAGMILRIEFVGNCILKIERFHDN